jgi:hypothetical protein
MSHGKEIFTDAIKDVIGNEPVLDQFDIDYEASFYGTMTDDFITGSMLERLPKGSNNLPKFQESTRKRGRRFSKYYADSASPPSSEYGSDDVNLVPRLSYRLVPWHNRASRTAYRVSQCYDSRERFFDSCLPDFAAALKADGAEVWTTSNDPSFMLSPYKNVASGGSTGYILFNSLAFDRAAQGVSGDPLTDNDWTWSYPYEGKYSPGLRLLKTTDALGIEGTKLSTRWEDVYPNTSSWGGLLRNELTQSTKLNPITNFIPLLPGHIERSEIESYGGRNSFRSHFISPGPSGDLPFVPAPFNSGSYDDEFGLSYLIPTDVRLNSLVSHDYLDAYPAIEKPAAAAQTGSMFLDDIVKFLFGFGDMNNLAWGRRLFESGSSTAPYRERFEVATTPPTSSFVNTYANNGFSSYSSQALEVNWVNNTYSSTPGQRWYAAIRSGSFEDFRKVLDTSVKAYNWISASSYDGSTTGKPPPLYNANAQGLFWETIEGNNSGLNNSFVLLTERSLAGLGFSYRLGFAFLDITSSLPWGVRYKRAVAAGSQPFGSASVGTIGGVTWAEGLSFLTTDRSHFMTAFVTTAASGLIKVREEDILDFVTGSSDYGLLSPIKSVMQQYDSSIDGAYSNPLMKYPFQPGEKRLMFFGNASFCESSPSVVALDDIEIVQYPPECFPPDTTSRIGANNYPEFRSHKVDARFNPIAPGTRSQVTGTIDRYSGEVFGVSPVIRGWKYGLYSGLPMNSKAVFRRDKYGQLRDMLEQRPFTKYIDYLSSPTDDDAIVDRGFDRDNSSLLTRTRQANQTREAPVSVVFVKQKYVKDDRGIGSIFSERVDPYLTTSQNLSPEVTSSLPYFDGIARHRQESDITSGSA